jgi:hypothetical protein
VEWLRSRESRGSLPWPVSRSACDAERWCPLLMRDGMRLLGESTPRSLETCSLPLLRAAAPSPALAAGHLCPAWCAAERRALPGCTRGAPSHGAQRSEGDVPMALSPSDALSPAVQRREEAPLPWRSLLVRSGAVPLSLCGSLGRVATFAGSLLPLLAVSPPGSRRLRWRGCALALLRSPPPPQGKLRHVNSLINGSSTAGESGTAALALAQPCPHVPQALSLRCANSGQGVVFLPRRARSGRGLGRRVPLVALLAR